MHKLAQCCTVHVHQTLLVSTSHLSRWNTDHDWLLVMILQSRLIYTHVKLDFEVKAEKWDDCLFMGTFIKIQKNVEHFNRRCTVTSFIVHCE